MSDRGAIFIPQDYPYRTGTSDSGKDYELLIATYLLLRFTANKKASIWFVMNCDYCGAFDDIVLCRHSSDGSKVIYLIQLKHEDKGSDITTDDFKTKKKSAFYLEKYFNSIIQVKEDIYDKGVAPESELHEMVDYLRYNSDKLVFVLFTNRGTTSGCDFLKPILKNSELDINWKLYESINTNGNVFQFDLKQLNRSYEGNNKFLRDKLFLFTKQMHVSKLNGEIENLLKSVIHPVKISKELLSDLALKFMAFIKHWSKGELGGYYPISSEIVLKKLVELLLEPYMVKLDKVKTNEKFQQDVWISIISDIEIIIINDADDFVMQFVIDSISNIITKFQGYPSTKTLWREDKDSVTKSTMKLLSNGKHISFDDAYQYLWRTGKIPLILEVNDCKGATQVHNVMKMSKSVFRVIIFNKSTKPIGKLNTSKTFTNLYDLESNYRKILLQCPIFLQGRESLKIPLENLISEKSFKYVTVKDVVYILSNKFSIGKKSAFLPEFFVEMSLTKVWLEPQVLDEVDQEIFVVNCHVKNDFFLFLEKYQISCNKVQILRGKDFEPNFNGRIIIYEDEELLEKIKNCYKGNRTVHFLILHNDDNIEWISSVGTPKNIKLFRKTCTPANWEVSMSREVVTRICDKRQSLVVSANPGMGKTVLINYIAQNIHSSFWVLKINLSEHKDFYESWAVRNRESSTDKFLFETFIDKLWVQEQDANIDLIKTVFKKFFNSRNVLFLLDAFDEVSITCQNGAKNFIKYIRDSGFIICITTRPVFKTELETITDSFSVTLNLFTEVNQIYFLTHHFAMVGELCPTNEKVTSFTKRILEAAKKNLNDRDGDFVGVPLQTTLLAEIFTRDFMDFLQTGLFTSSYFDLLYLYEHFIKRKIAIACDKIGSTSEELINNYNICRSFYALQLLFSEDDLKGLRIKERLEDINQLLPDTLHLLQRDGIVVAENQSNVNFIHRTFGEYLVAKWLSEHIKDGHKNTVQILLKKTFDPRFTFIRNVFDRILAQDCPLHLLIINQQVDKIKEVIGENSNIFDKKDKGERTCLHVMAAWGSYHPCVLTENSEILVSKKVETKNDMLAIIKSIPSDKLINNKDELFRYTPLDYAICSGSLSIAQFFCKNIKHSNKLNCLDNIDPALINRYCIKLNYISVCWVIETNNVIKDSELSFNKSSLHYAVQSGDIAVVRSLISNVTNINQDKNGCTALHVAVKLGHIEIVHLLLSKNADPNIKDSSGRTSLHWASQKGHANIVLLLLSNKIDTVTRDKNGMSALHHAVFANHNRIEVMSVLLLENELVIDINTKDATGKCALHCAAYVGYADLVNLLLFKGADIEAGDSQENTALIWAAHNGHLDVVNLLLNRGANIHARDFAGWTPLHMATHNGHTDVIIALLSKGANLEARNNDGSSPLNGAVFHDDTENAKLLLSMGANINARNKNGFCVLHWAAHNGHTDTINLLLENEADINALTFKFWTPLHFAAFNGHTNSVKLLLSKGASLNVQTIEGWSPLYCAIKRNQTDSIAFLVSIGAQN